MRESVGFIGLGNMGKPMALNLLRAGYALRVYNRDPDKTKPLVEAGAQRGIRPRDTVEHGAIAVTMLADDEALEAVTLGIDGILEHLGPGGLHISMSTVSPDLARKLDELHTQQSCTYVAAPVFGRPDAAGAHKLWVAVAGKKEGVERARPILETIGQRVFEFGSDPSQANIVKISGNFLIAAAMEAIGEASVLAEKNGVDPVKLIDMLSQTLFAGTIYQGYGKKIAERNYTPVGFQLKLGLKDVNLVRSAAEQAQVTMPFANLVHDRFLSGIAKGRGEHDWVEMVRGISDDAGIEQGP